MHLLVEGLALLAATFPDRKERSLATSKVFAGISLGMTGRCVVPHVEYTCKVHVCVYDMISLQK